MIKPNSSAFTPDNRAVGHEPDGLNEPDGLTIRAYIASQAMAAIMNSPHYFLIDGEKVSLTPTEVANVAVQYADALIEQLNKPETKEQK